MKAFVGDSYAKEEFERLIRKHRIKNVIETGTFLGDTSLVLASMANQVFTIENNKQFALIAKRKFKNISKIELMEGSSPDILLKILPTLKANTLLFLDAHWYNYWPILDELEAFSKYPKYIKVIAIHDFYVPGRNFGYDSYIKPTGSAVLDNFFVVLDMLLRSYFPKFTEKLFNKRKLDLSYIENTLMEISKKYSYHYNSKALGKKRGIIYIEF